MTRRPSPPHRWIAAIGLTLGAAIAVCADVPVSGAQEQGGGTTVFDEGPTAFGRALANLDPLRWNDLRAGKLRFMRRWPEVGPWADAVSCAECHYHDGRGPRADQVTGPVQLVRLGGRRPGGDPVYGVQLRRLGIGVPAPGRFAIDWEESPGRYPDGDTYVLRRPTLRIIELGHGQLAATTRVSLRVAPAVFGLGLLEAIAADDLRRIADPADVDGDGVSGRLQQVLDSRTGRLVPGRFGWKAAQPSLYAQSDGALMADLGVISPTAARANHDPLRLEPRAPEIAESDVQALVTYLRALAVPAQRHATEAIVREGDALFDAIGCGACHRRSWVTGSLSEWPELSGQAIRPYTDLLLHDLGADLADGVEEGAASGGEWRTPPLWGLGLLATVSGQRLLLHDGRARSVEEAILWHGGEAAAARDRFRQLRRAQRQAVTAFLESL